MSVATSQNQIFYQGNASTVVPYPVPFSVLLAEHLHVEIQLAADPAGAWSSIDGSFTVTLFPETGFAEILTIDPIPADYTVRITRWVPITQPAVYPVGGTFPAKSHEMALDWGTMIDQQLKTEIDTHNHDGTYVRFEDLDDLIPDLPTGMAAGTVAANPTGGSGVALSTPVGGGLKFTGGSLVVGGAEDWRQENLYFADRTDNPANGGTGTINDPYDASSAAKIDAILGPLSVTKTKANFHWGPGTYLINAVKAHYPPPYTPAWVWRDGWHWEGAGPDRTFFKFVNDRVWPPEDDPNPPRDSRIMFRSSFLPGEGEIVACGSLRRCTIDGDTHGYADPGSGVTYTQAIGIECGSFVLEDVIVENMGGRGQEMFPISFSNGLWLDPAGPPPPQPCFITMRRVQIRSIYNSGGGAGVLVHGNSPLPNQRFLMEDCHFKDCYICFASWENIDILNSYFDIGAGGYGINFDTGTVRNVRIIGNTILNYEYVHGQVGGVNIGTIEGASHVSHAGNNSSVTPYPVPYEVDAASDLHVEIRLTPLTPEDAQAHLQDKWTVLAPADYTVTLIPGTGFASVVTHNPIAATYTVRITRWLVSYENFLISGNYFKPKNGGVFPMVRAAGAVKNLTIVNNYLQSNTTVPGLGYIRDDDVYPGGDTHYWSAGVGFPPTWHPPYIPNGPIFAWGNRVIDGGYTPLGLPDTVLGDLYATADIHAGFNFRAGNGFVGDRVLLATGFVATGAGAHKIDPYVSGTFWDDTNAKAAIEIIQPGGGIVALNLQRTGADPVKWNHRIPAAQTWYEIGPDGTGVNGAAIILYIDGNVTLPVPDAVLAADVVRPMKGLYARAGAGWPVAADYPVNTGGAWHNSTTNSSRYVYNQAGAMQYGQIFSFSPLPGTPFATGAAWPLPADIAPGTSVTWKNTTAGTLRTCANDAGTIRMSGDFV